MPQYEAELSDGRVVTVESDKPPTGDQILSAIGRTQPRPSDFKPDGSPQFTPARELAPPPEGEEELLQAQAHPITTPLARIIPKASEELMGKAASLLPSIAREWYEAIPETRTSPEEPPNPSLKEKALYAVAGATPSDKAISVATGVQNASADLGNFFTSPLGIATLGIGSLPAAAGRAVALGFAATMAKDVPEIATQLGEELGKPEDQRDYRKISELTANAAANTGFAALGAAHGIGKPLAEKFGAYPTESNVTTPVTQEKGQANAETVRGNQGQLFAPGQEPQRGGEVGGNDVQQPPSGTPNAPRQHEAPQNVPNEAPMSREEAKKIVDEHDRREKELIKFLKDSDSAQSKVMINARSGEIVQPLTPDEQKIVDAVNAHGGEPPDNFGPPGNTYEQSKQYKKAMEVLRGKPMGFEAQSNIPAQVAPLPGEPGYVTPPKEAAADQTPFSMGGLAPSDPLEVAGKTEGNPDIYGIAQRVREERAAAGQVAEVLPGKGITPEDSIIRGRDLLKADPTIAEARLKAFESDPNKAISADDIAAIRAKGEELAKTARSIEEKFGTESEEFKKAWKALSDWDARSKPMQTEWHKIGQAQQGETDLDTGSFTGLQREFKNQTGKEFSPEQKVAAKRRAEKVSAASKVAAAAKEKLFDAVAGTFGIARAERRALDEANRTVREAAARLAKIDSKKRVAESAGEREVQKLQEDAARKALEAAQKQAREAAIRLAHAENEGRQKAVDQSKLDEQEKAAKDALDAASKTVREAAARAARAENKARTARAAKEKAFAEKEAREAQRALKEAQAKVRSAAIEAARQESINRVNPERVVWKKVKEYIDKGVDDFDDIRHKVATDLGISIDRVAELMGRSARAKFLTNDLWRKQQTERRLRQQAKQWLNALEVPGYQKAIASIPKILFSLKVGFHGTVALGTHAPMVAFQPRFWNTYVRDFGKMYKMVGNKAYYERQVQDLLRRPNYTTARRAGLVNDPSTFEDFNSPDTSKYFGKVTGMGNRGYSVLKILRQDMFDQMWDQLPRTAKIPEVAEAIADGLNHATGVVKGAAPKGANVLMFAPRLLASRVMWLAVDPIKAVDIFARWRDASPGEKRFAINQVQEKAWVAATLFGMLALNQGFLSAIGSDQKVNLTDPFKNDFLKFKVAGMTASYGNAMLTMARLPIRLYKIRSSDGGKLKALVYPDEDTYSVLGEYARSQMSPFASLVADLWLKQDWQRRQLPNSERPMPKRLRQQGEVPYTWPEFWAEQVLPIPAEEAAREVWRHGLGASDEQVKALRKALATIAVMGATGARLTEDTDVSH